MGTEAVDRRSLVDRMTIAGQALAAHWGHQPWSDSWARQVAEAMLDVIDPPEPHWECEDCHCVNRDDEAGCFRCGAGRPEE